MKKWTGFAAALLLITAALLMILGRSTTRRLTTSRDANRDGKNATPEHSGTALPRPTRVYQDRNVKPELPRPISPAGRRRQSSLPSLPSPLSEDWDAGKFFRFSADEWRDMASRCEMRWQLPPFGTSPDTLAPDEAQTLGLTPTQGDEYNDLLVRANQRFSDAMRALYAEMTGDPRSAKTLPLRTILDDLRRDSGGDADMNRKLALEQAGDGKAGSSIYERYMRLQLSAGDDFQAALTRAFGPGFGLRLREQRGPKFTFSGCNSEHGVFRSERIHD